MSIAFYNRRSINIDIGHRCSLECLRCARRHYTIKKEKVPGYDITMDEYLKVIDFFTRINFSGQYSDPVHHPLFIDFLKLNLEKNISTQVHNASSQKPFDWYIKAFKANPKANWIFGIDGLPEESCMYRVNQDGEKLYKVMLESKKYLKNPPRWQYIVFNYNENHVEQAKEMAMRDGVEFLLLQSSRWARQDDPLMPSEKYRLSMK